MTIFTDQMGRSVRLDKKPQRIISIVPSQTELLHDLGLGDEVVGITKFCIHPGEWFRAKARVGGTKMLDLKKIHALQPDLIIGNKEENEREQVEELMKRYPVWMSDITTLDDSLEMIRALGEITGTNERGQLLADKIASHFTALQSAIDNSKPAIRTAYFIWKNPYMAAGKYTFIDHLLQRCGLANAFALTRYPSVTASQIAQADPSLILLSSEPYPFKDKHIEEFQAICPKAKVMVVDGEMFSWYGSRLQHAPAYFTRLLDSL